MDKKVFVSAGGSGIGRCIAEAFLKNGDQVFVCDINAESLAQFKQDFPQLHTYSCDLAQPDAIQDMFQQVVHTFGHLDVLVNNTGISGPTVAAEDLNLEDWNAVLNLNLNLNSTFLMTKLAIPYLKQSIGGSIINISSVSSGPPLSFTIFEAAITEFGIVISISSRVIKRVDRKPIFLT